jgi:hypothetical protein
VVVYLGEREGWKISAARSVGRASSMEPLGGVLVVCCSDWEGVVVPEGLGVGSKISEARSVIMASFWGGDDLVEDLCDERSCLGDAETSQNWRVGMRATWEGEWSVIASEGEVRTNATYSIGLRQVSPVRRRAYRIPHPRASVDCDRQLCLRILLIIGVPRLDNMLPHESADRLSCAWQVSSLGDHPLSQSFCLGLGDVVCGEFDWRVQFRIKIGRVEERVGVLDEFPVWELV